MSEFFKREAFQALTQRVTRNTLCVCLAVSIAVLSQAGTLESDAKKGAKGGGASEEELKKNLEPLSKSLDGLMIKIQSRYLFSPKDSGQLAEIKSKLLDLMETYPTNPLIVKAVYQTGVLCSRRDQFNDAYELFTFVTANFPSSSYGQRAKGEIQQMKKLLGEQYFPAEPAAPEEGAPAAATGEKKTKG